MRSSFDTNIPVYALVDRASDRKTAKARQLLRELSFTGDCFINSQVLKEFASVATRKLQPRMSESNLLGRPQDLRSFGVVEVNQELIFKAVGRHFKSRISYYDALMVEAALYGGAGVPYSEDLQHGPDLEISKSSTLLCNPEAGACNAGDSAHDLD